jgi:hypothetical protein
MTSNVFAAIGYKTPRWHNGRFTEPSRASQATLMASILYVARLWADIIISEPHLSEELTA